MKYSVGTGNLILLGTLCVALASCGGGGSSGAASELPIGWVPTFGPDSNLSGSVRALTVFDDGSGGGPALYAGGDFTTAGGQEVNSIAKWDGSKWSALGTGMMDGSVLALTVFDDGSVSGPALYAGGFFTTAGGQVNRIAKWNGSTWSALGTGMNNSVLALTVFDDGSVSGPALYAGGTFTTAGGQVNRIAKWDGNTWSALDGGMDDAVLALTVFDDGSESGPALYAGGTFDNAGGQAAKRIAKWDGSTWSSLGTGVNNTVRALTVFDDGSVSGPALYAGGFFTAAGGKPASNIAKWDGSTWSALGAGVDNNVDALTVFDDGSVSGPALYAGGFFNIAGGLPANHIAKWDGSTWSALGAGVTFGKALAVFDDGSSSGGIPHGPSLFVGGLFGESPAGDPFLAKWGRSSEAVLSGPEDSQSFTALPSGLSGSQELPCALSARIGPELRLDDPELHLLLEHAHVAPLRNVEWLAGTIELRGGLWRQGSPSCSAWPARLGWCSPTARGSRSRA
jgi:trimeric autotransporter adhesin